MNAAILACTLPSQARRAELAPAIDALASDAHGLGGPRLMKKSELNMVFVATTFQGAKSDRGRGAISAGINNVKSLVRFEFAEALVRIAMAMFYEGGSCGGKELCGIPNNWHLQNCVVIFADILITIMLMS